MILYEDQAAGFDERVGLPPEACEEITQALDDIVGLEPGKTLLEVGAGTGSLSIHLLRRPIRYIGFDRSGAMLDVFRERVAGSGLQAELVVADGNGPWPADDGSVDIIFSARAIHHIDVDHVVEETLRVLRDTGGWLVVGRMRRPGDSVKSVMRRRLRDTLREEGYAGRSHESHAEKLFDALERAGARKTETRRGARLTGHHRPIDSLTSWEGKAGLAGLDIPDQVKTHVLERLRAWAEGEYGDLDRSIEQEEFFELDAIQVGAR